IPDIETICSKLPATRQTLLFSATMPPPIKKLADKFLSNPKYIEVARPASTNTNIAQHKVAVATRQKREVLRHLLRTDNVSTAIVFCNRKTTVRELNKSLQSHGFASGEIHGDMDQPARLAELQRFKDGKINILVASDVAARGLDIKGVSHVFNFDTPWHPDDYVHRIGRTGRAGATGRAFTLIAPDDAEAIDNVEKLTGGKIPVFEVALEGGAERPRREGRDDKPRQSKQREDAPREDRPREDKPREDRPRRERAPRAKREEQVARPEPSREPRQRRADPVDPPSEPGEWNGPVPGFLSVSAL
ncbi:MAG: DEAD/DEAH box helicase, partial [Sphingomonadales bacterium]|nr:DEAD/DEAH box helicase [Sphingomonadales bacterium]